MRWSCPRRMSDIADDKLGERSAEVYSRTQDARARRRRSRRAFQIDRGRGHGHNELRIAATRHRHTTRNQFLNRRARRSAAHQKSGDAKRAGRVRPPREASLRADRHPNGKFGARSLVDHELRAAGLSRGSQRLPRALRITDRAWLRARRAAPALAPAAAISASPKKTRRGERSARKNRTGRALQPNESSTRRLRRATARDPAGSRQFHQECERRCTTNEDAYWPAPFAPGLLRSTARRHR